MRMGILSILLAAAAVVTGAATAQESPSASQASSALPPTPFTSNASNPQDSGWDDWQDRFARLPAGKSIEVGFRALDEKDFSRAEEVFADAVQRDPRNARANFYLGATRMGLGKWQDAKRNLEIAAKEINRHPDPKSRLGVTYAMLGNVAGANAQRAELVKMANACNNACKLSPYIKNGIRMIDDALVQPHTQG